MQLGRDHPGMAERHNARTFGWQRRLQHQFITPAWELVAQAIGEPKDDVFHRRRAGPQQEIDRRAHPENAWIIRRRLFEAAGVRLESDVIVEVLLVAEHAVGAYREPGSQL